MKIHIWLAFTPCSISSHGDVQNGLFRNLLHARTDTRAAYCAPNPSVRRAFVSAPAGHPMRGNSAGQQAYSKNSPAEHRRKRGGCG
eukprot:scaffold101509_cov41-Tisochrysis_lutea.AAC.1